MLLRRFMKHIKAQNWIAVLLDVIVVIVGIFLGLQVQQWYEARSDRDQEEKYLEQLHDEVAEVELRYENTIHTIDQRVKNLQKILNKYNENGKFVEFENSECNVILVSHLYTNFISPITVINELETSGRSHIIQSDEIRKLIVKHKMNENTSDKFTSNLQARGIQFQVNYPEFMELNKAVTISSGINLETDVGNRCKVPTSDKTIDFKNSIVANVGRYEAYNTVVKRQFESLLDLHKALDNELRINH